jgi:1-acyl-sn-glycerol-3-phosphate acyltransferase
VTAHRSPLRAAWDFVLVIVGFAYLGLICFVFALAALVLLAFMPAARGRRFGRRGAMWAFRIYLAPMEWLGAWRLDLRELDALHDAGPLVIAPNHPGLLDAVLLVSRLPHAVCVMKSTLINNFLLGPWARLSRYVPNDTLLRLITRASEELRAEGQLLLFPEGTRSTGHPIGPFTEAVGGLARRAGVPVQTVIIEASASFLGKGWSLSRMPPLPISYRVRLGRRFDPPQDVRAFTADLERYFRRELAAEPAPVSVPMPLQPAVTEANRIRG